MRSWVWSKTDSEQRQDESFDVTFGTYVNHGIQGNNDGTECTGEVRAIEDSQSVTVVDEENGSSEHDELEAEEEEEATHPCLRRSERQSIKPKYLDDYIFLAIKEGERLLLCLNNELLTLREASESREWR